MMVTKQTLHVAGVVRSPQLQYELSEALAEDIGTEVDLRVGGLKAWAPGLLVAERTPSVLLLEIDVEPVMPALVRLRNEPGILGVSLRSGSLRIYAGQTEELVARWKEDWPFPELRWLGHRWVEPDMEDVFTAYSQGYDAVLKST